MNQWRREREQVINDVAGLLGDSADRRLPLSVRDSAAQAAVVIVESWFAAKTYDEWADVQRDLS